VLSIISAPWPNDVNGAALHYQLIALRLLVVDELLHRRHLSGGGQISTIDPHRGTNQWGFACTVDGDAN
jgi:hypothetical protein